MSPQDVFVILGCTMVLSTYTGRDKWCWQRRRIFFCWLLFTLIAAANVFVLDDDRVVSWASVSVQMFLICFVPCGIKRLNQGLGKVFRTAFFLSLAVLNGLTAWKVWQSGG